MSCSQSNVTEFLLEGRDLDRTALQLTTSAHTYLEVCAATAQVARYLLRVGGQKGDRVILISDNSLFWVAAYLGALRAGLVCVPLPTSISGDEFERILQNTESGIAFVQAGWATRNRNCFRGMHLVTDREVPCLPEVFAQRAFSQILSDLFAASPFPRTHRDDLAALMFTSGSTGEPRGVMLSHGNIIANTTSIIEYLGLTGDDRTMAVLPFHYCFGTSLLHTHLRVGASLILESRFMYPETVLQRLAKTHCTGFAGVPSHFQILLRSSSLKKRQFPHLRYIQQAGGYLPQRLISELRETLSQTQIFVMYGQTEATARLSYLPPSLLDAKSGSIGKGIPGVNLRVINEDGVEVAPGEVGEIVATGDNVAQGYWRAPEESALTFRDGVLHTGDLARVDADRFIYIVDRAKDFVKCGGERVSCRQLEEQLLEHEDVDEAAVIGIPDDVLGEAVKAFVVSRAVQRYDLQERLILHCRTRMPAQLVPKEIIVLDALPKNSAGKILKSSLKHFSEPVSSTT